MMVAVLASCAQQPQVPQPVEPEPVPIAAVEEPQPPPPPRDLARNALALFDKKEWNAAVPALTEAAAAYPEIAPFLRLRIAEAEVARGNVQSAVALLSEIIAISDTSAATVARLRLPVLYAQLGDRAATDSAWAQANAVAIDELTETDFVSMANALAKAGRTDLATSTRMRLLTTYTQGRYTEQTFDHVKGELAGLPPAERLALAAKLARADRYDQALSLLPADAPEARATRIRALFNSRHYSELLAETDGVKLGDPALVLTRARAAWRADSPALFLAGLDAVEKEFPASKEAIEAKILRAKYYTTDVIDYARAVDNLSKAIDAGAGDEHLWNLGWTYTLWGKYDEALAVYDRYIRAYPDGDWKTNSLFWSAKIHDRFGRTAERDAKAAQIVAEYPFSYYAYRAKELWPSIRMTETKSLATFPDVDVSALNEPRLNVVRALQDVGLDRAAAREMKVLAAKYDSNPAVQFMLADVYVRGGEPFKANGVLQRRFREFVRHGGTNIPRRFWEILFPLAYWDTIRAEAEKRGHDPYMLASIIRQESGFEPATVSNAGAVGLMQIMPAEASRIGTAGGLGEITRSDLFIPEKNIAVGAAELSQKLAATNNNLTLAIAAYNAGETAVQRWMSRTSPEEIDLFIESIPYAETRLYVKTVTRNRNEYRRIYER
ncbi:MAG TPA: transglycosylase SLT domain-containing protein [Thermoanaerobaculia bacterium]|nr:transglycosylase SLT domain-containing protein [Thermoanaerobaculia bacterium]